MTLAVIKPVRVTDDMLLDTNVPEDDHGAWDAGATYALGDRVLLTSTHKVYESLSGENVGNNPVSSLTDWIEVGPTNRWRLFDTSNSTVTSAADSMFYELQTGAVVNAVALLNVNAYSVRVRMTDPVDGVVYDKTTSLLGSIPSPDWYDFFFALVSPVDTHVALDMPSYADATLRVDLFGDGLVSCGILMFGYQLRMGEGVEHGARVGIQDYSRKERNEFGDTVLVQRAFARRAELSMMVRNGAVDGVMTQLSRLRATPVLWVGYERLSALTVFGFFKDFEIDIAYPTHSECTLSIEGLT
jgi:hypothetical protein